MSDEKFVKLLDFLEHVMGHAANSLEFRQQVLAKLDALKSQGENIMAVIDDLEAKVTAQTTVIGSAVTLLQGLKAALDAAGTDPAKLSALSTLIGGNTQSLADAVAANTPAASV